MAWVFGVQQCTAQALTASLLAFAIVHSLNLELGSYHETKMTELPPSFPSLYTFTACPQTTYPSPPYPLARIFQKKASHNRVVENVKTGE